MNDPHVFGYGSLVNHRTHAFPDIAPARVRGWRRAWAASPFRPVAFLSVRPDPGAWVLGAVARVPGGDWVGLDQREAAYRRHPVSAVDAEHSATTHEIHIYAAENPPSA